MIDVVLLHDLPRVRRFKSSGSYLVISWCVRCVDAPRLSLSGIAPQGHIVRGSF